MESKIIGDGGLSQLTKEKVLSCSKNGIGRPLSPTCSCGACIRDIDITVGELLMHTLTRAVILATLLQQSGVLVPDLHSKCGYEHSSHKGEGQYSDNENPSGPWEQHSAQVVKHALAALDNQLNS